MDLDRTGELVRLVREARGLTQKALAAASGLSQSKLSKIEKGLITPTNADIRKLARGAGVPHKLFYTKEAVRAPGVGFEMYYRKQASTRRRLLRQVEARMELFRQAVSRLVEDVDVVVDYILEHFDPEEHDPEEIAYKIRVGWQIPSGPIRQLAPVLEAAGVFLVPFDFGTKKIDAVSVPSPRMYPLVFYRPDAPGCRLRLSLSHELGHLLMHRFPTEDMEDEANRFAAAFLMPKHEFLRDVRGMSTLRVEHLSTLKQKWFVSMAAIARRAHELGVITDWNYKSLNIEINKRGWRTREPVTVPSENASLLSQVIETHLDDGLNVADISEFSFLPEDEVMRQLDPDHPRLRIV